VESQLHRCTAGVEAVREPITELVIEIEIGLERLDDRVARRVEVLRSMSTQRPSWSPCRSSSARFQPARFAPASYVL
jgi:hypothetical protein